MPPVHHLGSILRNTEVFRAKWGEYTMGHWLHAFTLMGLVEETPQGWRRLREPGLEDSRADRAAIALALRQLGAGHSDAEGSGGGRVRPGACMPPEPRMLGASSWGAYRASGQSASRCAIASS